MILSLDTQRDIRNAALSALHNVAYDQHCEVSDILALITPSQPDPKQVASSAATAPGGVTAEVSPASDTSETGGEVPPTLPASPSPDHLPDAGKMVEAMPPQLTSTPAVQAQNVESSSEVLDGPSLSLPGAERAADPAPSKPAEVSKLAAHTTLKQRIIALHAQHPEFTVGQATEHLKANPSTVGGQTSALGLHWAPTPPSAKKAEVTKAAPPKPAPEPAPAESRGEFEARLIALHTAEPDLIRPRLADRLGVTTSKLNAAVARLCLSVPHVRSSDDRPYEPEVIPPATPQTPVAPPPVGQLKTLSDRVAALHHQHPTWTGRMIANELGANAGSVSVALARIRNPKPVAAPEHASAAVTGLPNVPAGAEESALKASYADVRKRLGAPS